MSFRDAEALVSTLFSMARGAAEATIRRRVRGEAALIVGSKNEGSASPAAAIDIGIDTTFIRSCTPKPCHHEVLLGCATTDDGRSRRIGAVLDVVEQPHALVAGALDAVGRGEDTAVSAFTDGDRMLRSLLVSAGVDTRPILDWPHIARKLQAAIASEKRLRSIGPREQAAHEEIRALLSRLRWRLWHGKTAKAVRALDRIERRLKDFGVDLIRPKTDGLPGAKAPATRGRVA